MPTTPNMGLILPTEGASDDVWDTLINNAFGVGGIGVDAHDHTTGKGVKIPSAALKINADVAWSDAGVNYAITALKAIDFTPVTAASVAALAGAFFVSSADNELYYRTIAGTNIKLTSGATINISIVGGIGGDYSSIGAEVAYVDADDTYTFKQQSSGGVRQWARRGGADVDLYEYRAAGDVTSIANRVRLSSPGALAASYALTFPAALPASTSVVTISAAGAIATTLTPTVTTLTVTGAATVGTTLGVTGLITATAGLTCAANQHVTVSGTGRFKHGTLTLIIPAGLAESDTATAWQWVSSVGATASGWAAPGINDILICGISLPIGKRIQAVRAMVRDTAGANTINMQLRKSTSADANTQVGATQTSAGDGSNQTLAITGLTETVATGVYYNVAIQQDTATSTTTKVYGFEIDYDHP